MNNSTLNVTTPHPSAIVTAGGIWQIDTAAICMLSFSFLFGLPTHSYVFYLIVRSGITTEFLNFNLSICEMLFSLNSLFIILTTFSLSFELVTDLLFGLSITGRPLFQCLICVERYLAVVHPVTFLKYKPLRYRLICSIAAWIIIFGSCLCCFIILTYFSFYIFIWFFFIQFFLFLSIKLLCLLAIIRALRQSGPGERGREREEENCTKRRVFHLILIISVSKFIAYVPFTVTGLLAVVTQQCFQVLWTFSFICFTLAGFVQPVLYLHRIGKI